MATTPGQQKYDPQTYRSGTRKGITGAVFSSNIPHRAPLLCYIAGIECPIIQASVSYGVWRIPEAQVALFPDPSLQRFGAEDRVNIVVFYLDEYIDPTRPAWRMLFEGEIVGWGYVNTPGGRSLQLNAVADISIFTQLFFFYMTTMSSVAAGVLTVSQSAETIGQAAAVFPYALFRKGLVTSPGTGTAMTAKVKKFDASGKATAEQLSFNTNYITRPYDFAYNVVVALIGKNIPDKQRCVPAVNFFSRWVRRTQFHNKWVALPYLDEVHDVKNQKVDPQPSGIFPVLRAVQSQKAVECLQNYVAAQNANAAIFTLLKQVLDTVFMEVCMLPTPAAVIAQTDGAITGDPKISDARIKFMDPSEKVTTSENDKRLDDEIVFSQKKVAEYQGIQSLLLMYDTASKQPQSGMLFQANDEEIRQALADINMPLPSDQMITRDLLDQALTKVATDIKTQEARAAQAKSGRTPAQPIRLTNYFIKPQFLFGLPPVCNVIFPSMTPQIQYNENYIVQPTRLYIQDEALASIAPLATSDPTLNQTVLTALARAYPPAADVKFQEHMKAKNAESGKNVLIFPEEFFKGPVTSRFPAPPWLMYFAAENQTGGKQGGEQTPKTVTPTEGTTLTDQDVYKLYAQYEYFKQRFEQRNGAVICAFQPYVIPGFPLIVFDDFQSSLHLIGYLMNVSQSFTSRSVETSLNYSYARTIYEFFQDIYNEIWYPSDEKRKGLACAAAPPEPIPEIRDLIQHFDRAEQFYQALLYRRPATVQRPAVFQYRDILAFVKSDGTLERIVIEGLNEETIKQKKPEAEAAVKLLKELKNDANVKTRAANNKLTAEETTKVTKAVDLASKDNPGLLNYESVLSDTGDNPAQTDLDRAIELLESQINIYNNPGSVLKSNIGAQRELAPMPGYEAYFDSYDAAMAYCSRPICTLEEYIEFIGGVREGINDDMTYKDGGNIPSARYYTRIRTLKGGTEETIKTLTLAQQGLAGNTNEPLPDSFPDMRLEWDKAMLAYRTRIYSLVKAQR